MKISSSKYAALLYKATDEAEKQTLAQVLREFLVLLRKEKALHLLPRIISLYKNYYNKKEWTIDVKITANSPEGAKLLANALRKLNSGKVELQESVDEKAVGGVKIRINDDLTDNTLAAKLRRVHTALTQ